VIFMELQSTLTCPHCSHQATETMPIDACWFFYADSDSDRPSFR